MDIPSANDPLATQGSLYRKVCCDECNWQLWPVGASWHSPQELLRYLLIDLVCLCAGAPTHVKLSLVKARKGNWVKVILDEDKKES